jgi:hypothetical protein
MGIYGIRVVYAEMNVKDTKYVQIVRLKNPQTEIISEVLREEGLEESAEYAWLL